MAINLDEKYPGRAQPKSVRYPQGAFKNRTAPDSQDGTYLEQDWANDMSGFLQWLLANAGITANGQVDNALASQYGQALESMVRNWSSAPAGEVSYFARSTAPAGWLVANGDAVDRTQYANLFAAIGTTFGSGDGSTTFNLPDLRGEFLRGWDNSRGVDSGRTFGSSQSGQNQAHTHTGSTNTTGNHQHGIKGSPTQIQIGGNSSVDGHQVSSVVNYTEVAGNHSHTFTTSSSGGGEARPRNVALLVCIKY